MSIIEELYYGNINPYIRKNNDTELLALINRHESWLKDHLDGEALDTLKKLSDCHAELNCNTAYESFRDGFTLGAKLVMEVCYGRKENGE